MSGLSEDNKSPAQFNQDRVEWAAETGIVHNKIFDSTIESSEVFFEGKRLLGNREEERVEKKGLL